MSDPMRVRCLGDELSEYAASRLPVERQWAWDRHLVACRVCAQAVDDERRLRSVLEGAPSMPGDLRSSLLALGRSLAAEAPAPQPVAAQHQPLALLAPTAPACHRSPLRATVVAAAAASVSAAAAWSLTVIGTPVPVRTNLATTTPPAVQPAASRAPGFAVSVLPAVSTLSAGRSAQTVVLTRPAQRAQSTP